MSTNVKRKPFTHTHIHTHLLKEKCHRQNRQMNDNRIDTYSHIIYNIQIRYTFWFRLNWHLETGCITHFDYYYYHFCFGFDTRLLLYEHLNIGMRMYDCKHFSLFSRLYLPVYSWEKYQNYESMPNTYE